MLQLVAGLPAAANSWTDDDLRLLRCAVLRAVRLEVASAPKAVARGAMTCFAANVGPS